MDHLSKFPTVNKHYHYHYHYDMKGTNFSQIDQKMRFIKPSQSHATSYKRSWKNHINPEVTRLYEEISSHEPSDKSFMPNFTRLSQKRNKQYFYTTNCFQWKRQAKSKAQILKEIKTYEQYLKKLSKPSFYVPSSPNLTKTYLQNIPKSFPKRLANLNQITLKKQVRNKDLNDLVLNNTDSKLLLSTNHQISTILQTQNPLESLIYLTSKKTKEHQKYVVKSDIKSPLLLNTIDKRTKIRMNLIEALDHHLSNDHSENSNFSLFQRESKEQESIGSNTEDFEFSQTDKIKRQSCGEISKNNQQQKNQESYAFRLMREECNFLREKFIQHAEKESGLRF